MVLKRLMIMLLLAWPLSVAAQSDWGVEQWVEETGDEESAAEMNDLLLSLREQPVNLNDTVDVDRLPLISPFQRRALCNYILLYGQLLSLQELRFVPGFDSASVAGIEPYVVVQPCDTSRRWRLSDGRHSLVAAAGGVLERAAGYDNGGYEGDRLRSLMVYSYDLYGKLNVRLAAEKDAAEAWGRSNFFAYHLMVSDVGRVERLIAGRFNLQFGQGLTLWTGLRPFSVLGSGTLRFGSGVRQAATFYEDNYQEGLAARVRLARRLRLSAFASHALGERLSGGRLEYREDRLMAGVTAAWASLDSFPVFRDYAYNQLRFRGRHQFNIGADAVWQLGGFTLFGEASLGENGAPAVVGGVRVDVADGARVGLAGRYFHPEYHNWHAQPYSIGGAQGEQGLCLDVQSRLPLGVVLVGSLDIHAFSVLRYGSYAPGSGAWLRVQLQRGWGGAWQASLRAAWRQKERNVPNIDTSLYVGEQSLRGQWQAEVRYEEGGWRLSGKVALSRFAAPSTSDEHGAMAAVLARYGRGRLQCSVSAALFKVDGYYARIYHSEANLQYAWSMPVLNGDGARACLTVRWSLNTHTALAVKYTAAYFPGQESVGTGDAATEGPLRQSCMLQLRWHM